MFPSGVLVKARLDDLVSNLPEILVLYGPPGLKAAVVEGDHDPDPNETLVLEQWSETWCLLSVNDNENLTALVVESLSGTEVVSEFLTCSYTPAAGEYSYALFRRGEMLESFECRGPSMEIVNFRSEIRKVPLQSILRASEFMVDSMKEHGVDPDSGVEDRSGKAMIRVDFPGKRKFWHVLLGAVSKR
ncbi:MAG: hypothetical protein PVJ01_03135 [Pseudomonadota bacterium]|jgi:hypothetical protein